MAVFLFLLVALVQLNVASASSRAKLMGHGCAPCGDIYVVKEGETLQIISDKCHAPFILIDNPHIQDTDDVSPGSVLQITSTKSSCDTIMNLKSP